MKSLIICVAWFGIRDLRIALFLGGENVLQAQQAVACVCIVSLNICVALRLLGYFKRNRYKVSFDDLFTD